MRYSLFTILILLMGINVYATQHTVTVISGSGAGTFYQLIQTASSRDTITFSPSLIDSGDAVISSIFTYNISKPLTILGIDSAGHRIIFDSQNVTRTFNVNYSGINVNDVLRFINIDIRNAFVGSGPDGSGAALKVVNAYHLFFEDCRIYSCQAQIGGSFIASAIFNPSSAHFNHLTLNRCEVYNNTAVQNTVSDGTIKLFNTNTDVNITNCQFHHNQNVCISIRLAHDVNILNCDIVNNGSQANGVNGNGLNIDDCNMVRIDSCHINNNYSLVHGAGMNSGGNNNLLVTYTTFIGNVAGNVGGGVRDLNTGINKTRFEHCIFKDNTAYAGGGLRVNYASLFYCTIRNNSVTNHGGAILADDFLRLAWCTVDSNYAGLQGGAVYAEAEEVRLHRTTVSYNSTAGNGGAFYRPYYGYRKKTRILESTIAHNQAQQGGGFAYQTNGYFEIRNSTLAANSAGSTGKLIYYFNLDSIVIQSSIITGHNGTSANLITRYNQTSPNFPIVSKGYNILEPGLPIPYHYTDIRNATTADANLGPLALDSSGYLTMMPLLGSKAVNSGNPNDTRNAQNFPIYDGRRDRGAAESFLLTNYEREKVTVCDSILVGGVWYKTSGTYSETNTNLDGFDSTHVHIATVNHSLIITLNYASCQPLTWVDGNTYSTDSSGISVSFNAGNGCDSLVIMNYTRLFPSDSTTVSITSCDSIQWIDGLSYYTDTITPWITLTSQYACDSLVRLDFNHLEDADTSFTRLETCEPFTWIDGTTYYQDTIVTLHFTAQNTCDSVVQLELIVKPLDNTLLSDTTTLFLQDADLSVQWYSCDTWAPVSGIGDTSYFTATQNGNYAAIVNNGICSDTTNCITISGIGTMENEIHGAFIYPNPTQSSFQISLPSGWNTCDIEIRDLTGRLIHHSENYQSHDVIHLDASKGSYIVRMSNDAELIVIGKVVVY